LSAKLGFWIRLSAVVFAVALISDGPGVGGLGRLTSTIAALVFWILNSVTSRMNMTLLIPVLVGFLVSFANDLRFAARVTGSLGLLILACLFIPRDNSPGLLNQIGAAR
jgi:hypothetical protein